VYKRQQYQKTVDREKDWLETQIERAQTDLKTSVGRSDADKIIELRKLERDHKQALSTLEDDMVGRGFAFSTKRKDALVDSAEGYKDIVSVTSNTYNRQKADAELKAQRALNDARLSSTQSVEDALSKYTDTQKTNVQQAEGVLGSDSLGSLNDQYTQFLLGDVEGSAYMSQRQGLERANQSAEQQTANNGLDFTQKYGTDAYNTEFGDTSGYTAPENVKGTETLAWKRGKKAIKANKKYTKQYLIGQGIGFKQAAKEI
jgi:hypothetical protein